MKCPCEACKAKRAVVIQKRRTQKAYYEQALRALEVTAASEKNAWEQVKQLRDLQALGRNDAHLQTRNETMKQLEWTCGDGKRVKIMHMETAHLFYAIAKGYRSEYPDSLSRKLGLRALCAEAQYRLQSGAL
jgi:hypothetical protein